jgi:hypothetical protein
MRHQETMLPIKGPNIFYMRKIISCMVFLMVLEACKVPNHMSKISDGKEIQNISIKTATIVGLDSVLLVNYEKYFKKNFTSTLAFSQSIIEEFSKSLKTTNLVKESVVDFSADWEHINTMTSKRSYMAIEALFDKTKTDYLVFFDNFSIRQSIRLNENIEPFNMRINSNFREFIVLGATVTIYHVNTRRLLLEYDVTGEDQIFFFSYSRSMKEAKEKLIEHALISFKENNKILLKDFKNSFS